MTYLVATTLAVLLVQLGFLWRLSRALGRLQAVEERVTHFGDVLSLLTETADAGFRSVAGEVERLAGADGRSASAKARRIAEALRQGRTVADVAAGEQVSEGEVRLRLHLAPPTSDRVHDAPASKTRSSRKGGAAATKLRTRDVPRERKTGVPVGRPSIAASISPKD